MLGGGGYTIRNVSRVWAHETAVLTDTELSNELPTSMDYRSHYGPDFKLYADIVDPMLENMNSRSYLEGIRVQCAEYLR